MRLWEICSVLALIMLAAPLGAQQGTNPFDLIPRLDSVPRADSVQGVVRADTMRAVEPVVPPAEEPARLDELADLAEDILPTEASYRRVKLGVTLLILVVLAFMLTVLRPLIGQSVGAFLYANQTYQVYREHEGRGFGPFITLYSLFFLNAGVFLFYLGRFFHIELYSSPFTQLLLCIGVVTGLFLLKHLVLAILAFIFPVGDEINRYHFIMIIFGITLGIFLVPVNILMAYAPPGLIPVLAYGTLGIIALAYVFRHFRAVLIASKVLLANKFHFLLYICTVEIAPVLFLYRFALNQVV